MSVVIYHKSAVFTSAIYHSYTNATAAAKPAASVDQGAGVHDKAQREEIAREHPTHQHLLHST